MRCQLILGLLLTASACAPLQEIERVGDVTPPQREMFAGSPAVVYQRTIAKYDPGVPTVTVLGGIACIPQGTSTPEVSQRSVTDDEVEAIFQREFRAAGFRVADTVGSGGLFTDKREIPSDLRIGGIVTNVRMNVCFPMAGYGDWSNGWGEGSMRVEWQVYSDARKAVIYTTTQVGYGKVERSVPTAGREIMHRAWGRAVRALLADPGFLAIATSVPSGKKSGS